MGVWNWVDVSTRATLTNRSSKMRYRLIFSLALLWKEILKTLLGVFFFTGGGGSSLLVSTMT